MKNKFDTSHIHNLLPQNSESSFHEEKELIKKADPQTEKMQNVKYDPKACVEKRLLELIPDLDSKKEKIHFSKHQIDFYYKSKKALTYFESLTNIFPSELKQPFSDFSKWVGNLKYQNTINTNIGYRIQVNTYEHKGAIRYVVKKSWISYDHSSTTQEKLIELENFLRGKYNEFGLLKIINGCIHSVKPIEFNIIHLLKTNFVVKELLMSYGGEPITKYYKTLTSNQILDLLEQIIEGLNYFESYNIEHNDIKGDNILIDLMFGGKHLARFIDLDIGKNQSITNKVTKKLGITGLTPIYCAPEIYQIHKNNLENQPFNCWKAQIFSMGVLFLFIVGYFPNEKSHFFDDYKESLIKYEEFFKHFQEYILKKEDNYLKRVLIIIEISLSYCPQKRLSANEILEIMPLIKDLTIDEKVIKEKCSEIISKSLKISESKNAKKKCRYSQAIG